jgi:hypothetical protein
VTETYAVYVWGNYLSESEADRLPAWLEPDVLRGDRVFVHQHVTMTDEDPLRVDGARTVFAVDGEDRYVQGRELGVPGGEIVTSWEDPHGQWDMALVRH